MLDSYAAQFVTLPSPHGWDYTPYAHHCVERSHRLVTLIKNEFSDRLAIAPHTIRVLMQNAEYMLRQTIRRSEGFVRNGDVSELPRKPINEIIDMYTELQQACHFMGIVDVDSIMGLSSGFHGQNEGIKLWQTQYTIDRGLHHSFESLSYAIKALPKLDELQSRCHSIGSLDTQIRQMEYSKIATKCRSRMKKHLEESEKKRKVTPGYGDSNRPFQDPRELVSDEVYEQLVKCADMLGVPIHDTFRDYF